MRLRENLPWWSKVAAKLLLSRLPVPPAVWKRAGIFVHGRMECPEYSVTVFKKHFDRVAFDRKSSGFVMLELGPGDSIASGIIARACGAEATYLVDTGAYARADVDTYRRLIDYLADHGFTDLPRRRPRSFEEILEQNRIKYLTGGLASLRSIASESIDFAWSNAVYEHIRAGEIDSTTRELRRVLRRDGICSHTIDLKDHLGGGLNSLRFGPAFWEARWVASAGFYTNRLRSAQLIDLFRRSGFDTQVIAEDRWKELPIRRDRLAVPFIEHAADDLCIAGVDVILRPA